MMIAVKIGRSEASQCAGSQFYDDAHGDETLFHELLHQRYGHGPVHKQLSTACFPEVTDHGE